MKRFMLLATPRNWISADRSQASLPVTKPSFRWACGGAIVLGLFSLNACRISSDSSGNGNSEVKVVNGSAVTGRDSTLAKSVFHVNVMEENGGAVEKSCTAAAISENVAILAAHCIPRGGSAPSRLKIEGKNASVKQIVGPESLYEATILSEKDAAMDLAALVLESSSGPVFSGQEIATIAPTSAIAGTAVKMIGFGATELEALKNPSSPTASGQAAVGSQQILSADGSTYELKASEKDLLNPNSGVSIAAPGDSGAPLFNQDGQLIGLLVGLSYHNSGKPMDLSQDLAQIETLADSADAYGNKAVDLKSSNAQKVIQIALGQSVGPISYQASGSEAKPHLAICRRNRGFSDEGGGRGGRGGRDRFNGQDLADLLDRLRSGSGTGTGSRTGSSNSSSSNKLNDRDIEGIFNDL